MQLNDKEIHKLFIESVRYSLTHHSYAPSECADLIRAKWGEIPENTRVIIAWDVNNAIIDDRKSRPKYSDKGRWPHDIYLTWCRLQEFMGEKYMPNLRSLADVSQDTGSGIYFE
jgi:hypothetical protein